MVQSWPAFCAMAVAVAGAATGMFLSTGFAGRCHSVVLNLRSALEPGPTPSYNGVDSRKGDRRVMQHWTQTDEDVHDTGVQKREDSSIERKVGTAAQEMDYVQNSVFRNILPTALSTIQADTLVKASPGTECAEMEEFPKPEDGPEGYPTWFEDFKMTFKALDKNNNCIISGTELGAVLVTIGMHTNEDAVRELLQDRKIVFAEYFTILRAIWGRSLPDRGPEVLFKMFDADNSQSLEVSEVSHLLKVVNKEMPDDYVEKEMDKFHKGKKGSLNLEEFKLLYNHLRCYSIIYDKVSKAPPEVVSIC